MVNAPFSSLINQHFTQLAFPDLCENCYALPVDEQLLRRLSLYTLENVLIQSSITMTTIYNVYRVKSHQGVGARPHVGIALVPAQFEVQEKGRFYHVTGSVAIGMDYEIRPRYWFGNSRSYSSKEYVFQLPVEKLQDFEAISSAQKPPYDQRVVMTSDPASLNPPAPNCRTWVDEVLAKAKNL